MKREHLAGLAAVVGASFIIRSVLAWMRAAPALWPDEYTYSAIGRSIAESGRPAIRDGATDFPALLQPIVTAPAWLFDDVGLAFRLVQTMSALAMSLAAVPVYFLARRLGLGGRVALALGALAVLVPDLVYSSFVTSEGLAYPLLLAAVLAATRALVRPTRRAQLLFVAVSGLAAFARIQFAVLPLVYVLAAAALGLRERRLKSALREQTTALAVFILAATLLIGTGPSRVLGPYRGLFDHDASPLGIAHWAALDAMTLAYAAGWIVVPGAALGLALVLTRPRSRDELAFGAVAAILTLAITVEAGVLQAGLPFGQEIQERYVFYAVPLVGLCFALYASRGWPMRVPHLALAAALVLISVRFPLSTYARPATLDGSPILYAVYWLTMKLEQPGDAAGVVAAAVGLMSLAAVLASRRPRLATPLVLGLTILAMGVASAGAVAFDVTKTREAKEKYLPADPSWVDRAGVGDAPLVQASGGTRAPSQQELFWNRSIKRVLTLPDAWPFDRFGDRLLRIAEDGTLVDGGQAVRGPLVVDGYGSTVRLQGARLVQEGPTAALWVPERGGPARLSLYARGHYYDGWLAVGGKIGIWPAVVGGPISGWLELRLSAPRELPRNARLTFTHRQGGRTSQLLRPGDSRRVRMPICASGATSVAYRSSVRAVVGLRLVSVKSTAPTFVPDPRACPETAARQ